MADKEAQKFILQLYLITFKRESFMTGWYVFTFKININKRAFLRLSL